MKRFRPYTAGFIVLYVLICLSLVDAGWTLYRQITGTLNDAMGSFSMFSYLVAAVGIVYGSLYARSQVCIDDKNLRIAFPANIQPAEGTPRAMFIYRQGSNDLKLIDKTFALDSIVRYGYVEDLGFSRVDKSGATEKSPLFPVKEVCFLTRDGKRYHMNAAHYTQKQQREIFTAIQAATGLSPEGSLYELVKA